MNKPGGLNSYYCPSFSQTSPASAAGNIAVFFVMWHSLGSSNHAAYYLVSVQLQSKLVPAVEKCIWGQLIDSIRKAIDTF